jgi:hypothetical protein
MKDLDSLLCNKRRLPPINERKRVAVKDCSIAGNPYLDVDEGIAEEVRIFNDILGLKTYSSCEGHLFKKRIQASIHSRLYNLDQLNLIKKVVSNQNMLPIKRRYRKSTIPDISIQIKNNKAFTKSQKEIFEKKYDDSSVRFEYKQGTRMKKYFGNFSVRIIPKYQPTQDEWDKIRQERFSNVIRILYDAGLRKPDLKTD